jgi:hypothetical protein
MGIPRVGDKEGNHTHAHLTITNTTCLTNICQISFPSNARKWTDVFGMHSALPLPRFRRKHNAIYLETMHELRVILEVGFSRCESQILLPFGMSTTLAIRSGIYVTEIMGSRHFSCLQNVSLRKRNDFIVNSIHWKSETNFLIIIPTAPTN